MTLRYVLKDVIVVENAIPEVDIDQNSNTTADNIVEVSDFENLSNLISEQPLDTAYNYQLPQNPTYEVVPYEIYDGNSIVREGTIPSSFTDGDIATYMNNLYEEISSQKEIQLKEKIEEIDRKKILISQYGIDPEALEYVRKEINLPNGYPITFFVDKNTSLQELKHIDECAQYSFDEVVAMNTCNSVAEDCVLTPEQPETPFRWMIMQEEMDSNS